MDSEDDRTARLERRGARERGPWSRGTSATPRPAEPGLPDGRRDGGPVRDGDDQARVERLGAPPHGGRFRGRSEPHLVLRPLLDRPLPVCEWRPAVLPRQGGGLPRPSVRTALVASGQIPVYRKTGRAADAFRAAVEGVENGKCVAVFPEGTLTRDPDLWPMVGKTGAARIALQTRRPGRPPRPLGRRRCSRPTASGSISSRARRMQVPAGPPVDLSDLYDRR